MIEGWDNIEPALKNRSPLLAKQPTDMIFYSNLQNGTKLNQGFPPPGIHKFLNKPEEDRSIPDYPIEFSYHVNNIGFRGSLPSTDTTGILGFFGDSCTFGEGLPEEHVFPYKTALHYHHPILNLGMPGTGVHRIAMTFSAAVRIWNIETAIITFPNYARFNYVTSKNHMLSILPPHPTAPQEAEEIRLSLVKNFSEQYFISAAKDAITWIITTANERKINLILGSWDPHVCDIIQVTTGYLPVRFFMHPPGGDRARDSVHPGIFANQQYTNSLIDYIENKNYVPTY